MGVTFMWFMLMNFPARLIRLRKEKGYTQQSLADAVGLHVNQIKKYEAGTAQPTLKALVGVAKVLRVRLDALVFEDDERGPDEDLRLQFEALSQFSAEEKKIAKAVIEGLILKHDAHRFSAAS